MARYEPQQLIRNIERLMSNEQPAVPPPAEESPRGRRSGEPSEESSQASERQRLDVYRALNSSALPQMRINQAVDRPIGGTRMAFLKKALLRAMRPVSGRQAVFNHQALTAVEIIADNLVELSRQMVEGLSEIEHGVDELDSNIKKKFDDMAIDISGMSGRLDILGAGTQKRLDEIAIDLTGLGSSIELLGNRLGAPLPDADSSKTPGWKLYRDQIDEMRNTIKPQLVRMERLVDQLQQTVGSARVEFQDALKGVWQVTDGIEGRVKSAREEFQANLKQVWHFTEELDMKIETSVGHQAGAAQPFEQGTRPTDAPDSPGGLKQTIDRLAERLLNIRREARDHVDGIWKHIEDRRQQEDSQLKALQAMQTRVAEMETALGEVQARLIVATEQQSLLSIELQRVGSGVPAMMEAAPQPAAHSVPGHPPMHDPNAATPMELHQLELAYLRFQRQFRGDEKQLRKRQKEYVRVIREHADPARLVEHQFRILDVACGDGIFVEILLEEGWKAEGVDINSVMAKYGQDRNLPLHVDDALQYLASGEENAWDVITAFQFVEHLPPPALVRLLRGAHRSLRPGGILILETINPNTLMAHKWFQLDLTHERLIFPQMMQLLMETCGYRFVARQDINPVSEHERLVPTGDVRIQANFDRLNEFLYGPQDYYIVGRKPG